MPITWCIHIPAYRLGISLTCAIFMISIYQWKTDTYFKVSANDSVELHSRDSSFSSKTMSIFKSKWRQFLLLAIYFDSRERDKLSSEKTRKNFTVFTSNVKIYKIAHCLILISCLHRGALMRKLVYFMYQNEMNE